MLDVFLRLLENPTIELVFLILAVAVGAFLAVVVYMSSRGNDTNQIFALLAFFTILWLVTNYLVHAPIIYMDALLLHRLGIFFAAPMSALFFLLAHTMPAEKIVMKRAYLNTVILATVCMMLINISDLAFTDMRMVNGIASPEPGPGLLPFSILSTLFSVLAVYWLVRKYLQSEGVIKKQIGLVLMGVLIMLGLIIATILIPVVFFSSVKLLPLTPLYVLVFLSLTAYAITKYQLFNIKVLVTEALTLSLIVVLFARMFGNTTETEFILDTLVISFAAVFGVFLIKSVRREVEQRELIQKQEQDLELVNAQQTNLLHFISHEIKGYLTKSEAGFASIIEGDYGKVPQPLTEMSARALAEVRKGVRTVMDILDAANLKKGNVSYEKKPFDLKWLVSNTVEELRRGLDGKPVKVDLEIEDAEYSMVGDHEKIGKHGIRNLVDNAIRYTPQGTVSVKLSRKGNTFHFSVKDTGVGITEEDMKKLFTEGGHGKDSIKVNVHSTGYGLYIAKQIVDAHNGRIWAESEGPGKGATFIIELPAK